MVSTKKASAGVCTFRPDSHIFETLKRSSSSSSITTKMGKFTLSSLTQKTVASFASVRQQEQRPPPKSLTNKTPVALNGKNSRANSKSFAAVKAMQRKRNSDSSEEDDYYTDQEYDSDGNPLDMDANTPEPDDDWDPEKEDEEEDGTGKVIPVCSDDEEEEEDQETPELSGDEDEEEEGEEETDEPKKRRSPKRKSMSEEEDDDDVESEEDEEVPADIGIALNKPRRRRTKIVRRFIETMENGKIVPAVVEQRVFCDDETPVDYNLSADDESDADHMAHPSKRRRKTVENHQPKPTMNGNGNAERANLPEFLRDVTSMEEARKRVQAQFEHDFKNVVRIATLRKSNGPAYNFLIQQRNADEMRKLKGEDPLKTDLIQSYSNWSQMRGDFMRGIFQKMGELELEHVADIIRTISTSSHVTSHSLEDHLRECRGLGDDEVEEVAENSTELTCYISKRRVDLETGRIIHIRLPVVSLELHHGAGVAKVSDDNLFTVHKDHEASVLDHWFILRIFSYMSDYFEKWQANIQEKHGLYVDGQRFVELKDGLLLRSLLTEHDSAFSHLALSWQLPPNPIDYGLYSRLLSAVRRVLKD